MPSSLPEYVLSRIPAGDICASALKIAQDHLEPSILNHSLRVYLLAKWVAEKEGSEWAAEDKLPYLFVASVCHDFGTCDLYNGKQRFEVEGADAAKEHLLSHGVPQDISHNVWTAIAIHTSPGIAERIDPLSRLVRFGVMIDFRASFREEQGAAEYSAEIQEHLPRLAIEKDLGDAVVKQATKIPQDIKVDGFTWPSSQKHPSASWPGILLRAHLLNPDHEGVNPAF